MNIIDIINMDESAGKLKQENSRLSERLMEAHDNLNATEEELKGTRKDLERAEKSLEVTWVEFEKTKNDLEAATRELKETKNELEAATEELEATKRQLEAASNRHKEEISKMTMRLNTLSIFQDLQTSEKPYSEEAANVDVNAIHAKLKEAAATYDKGYALLSELKEMVFNNKYFNLVATLSEVCRAQESRSSDKSAIVRELSSILEQFGAEPIAPKKGTAVNPQEQVDYIDIIEGHAKDGTPIIAQILNDTSSALVDRCLARGWKMKSGDLKGEILTKAIVVVNNTEEKL